MCYNCSCGIREDNMGDPNNITSETFENAAKASSQTVEEAKYETYKLLKEEFEKKEQEEQKKQSQ
jgi:hypothetical protein